MGLEQSGSSAKARQLTQEELEGEMPASTASMPSTLYSTCPPSPVAMSMLSPTISCQPSLLLWRTFTPGCAA